MRRTRRNAWAGAKEATQVGMALSVAVDVEAAATAQGVAMAMVEAVRLAAHKVGRAAAKEAGVAPFLEARAVGSVATADKAVKTEALPVGTAGIGAAGKEAETAAVVMGAATEVDMVVAQKAGMLAGERVARYDVMCSHYNLYRFCIRSTLLQDLRHHTCHRTQTRMYSYTKRVT